MINTVITSSHPEQLRKEINGVLNQIPGIATDALRKAGKKVGNKSVKTLKQTAPKGATGKSSQAWKVTQDGNAFVIHSKSPYHSHPQWLEKGHKTLRGGSTAAFNYIAPVEKEAIEEFEKKFEKEFEKEMERLANT